MAWPRDAYVGQEIVSIADGWCSLHGNLRFWVWVSRFWKRGPALNTVVTIRAIRMEYGGLAFRVTGYGRWYAARGFRPLKATGTQVEALKRFLKPRPIYAAATIKKVDPAHWQVIR